MKARLEELNARIDGCMLCDRRWLRRRLMQLMRQIRHWGPPSVKAEEDIPASQRPPWCANSFAVQDIAELERQIEDSAQRAYQRARSRPFVSFPDELPISARIDEIAEALETHPVVIVCGETGSGKSTQLPKLCLALGRGVQGIIGHTQPRRIAARTIAARIASELGTELGQAVGYKVRFHDQVGPDTYIKLMTDGILLAEIEGDRWLEAYDTLIIDEAHERSLNIDLLLGYLKTLLPKRPELKLIITSATIDPERFSRHFDQAPVIEVSGRLYPVEVRYRPLFLEEENERDQELQQAILEAIDELSQASPGDILVFLPGEREIRETAESLRKHRLPNTEVLPLYARLSAVEQNRVFEPHNHRHIVLATNVAETSLTVPGIRYVIDPGEARINRYSPRTKVQRLVVERISKASANQRKGRCGRLGEGICIRLYSPEEFESRAEFTDPEILRTNLASVILKLKSLRFGEIEDFPFIDPPDRRYVNAGYKLLEELGALDAKRKLTPIGEQLARLPVDPRIGRMILAAQADNCLTEVLIIASALSIQDPRERPLEAREQADEAHRQFADERSDFLWYLNLWQFYQARSGQLSKNQLRTLCRTLFLSYVRMGEWQDLYRQLKALVHALGFRFNSVPADYEAIHRALLTGLLSHIGFKTEQNQYTGARGIKFHLFPGSVLFRKTPPWVMTMELVETSRLYARTAAEIEPEWIEQVAPHLVKRSYAEPHWEKRAGRVMAFERVTLYGLTLVARRKVDYSTIDPAESRRLFIQSALVEGDYEPSAPCFEHNQRLLREIEELQHRLRRLDILADEHRLFEFYDQRLPKEVGSRETFERWRQEAERDNPKLLYMDYDLLMQAGLGDITTLYPDTLEINGVRLPLSYRFEPGRETDGVTVTVPLLMLNQLEPKRFEWLIPGLLREKIAELIRSLPKALRRHFIPVEHYVEACFKALVPSNQPLTEQLTLALRKMTGIEVPPEAWAIERLPAYLRMNLRIVDEQGQILAEGRDLAALQARFSAQVKKTFRKVLRWPIEREGITRWDFGTLPQTVETLQNGLIFKGYPALVDRQSAVAIEVFDSEAQALAQGRAGLRRLFMLALPQQIKYLTKHLPGLERMAWYYASLGPREELLSELVTAIVDRVFVGEQAEIRTEEAFRHCLERGRMELMPAAQAFCQLVLEILQQFHAVHKALRDQESANRLQAVMDIRDQLEHLLYRGFITATSPEWLKQFPRYLKAIALRLEKLDRDPTRDRQKMALVMPFWQAWKQRLKSTGQTPELLRFQWMLEEFRVSVFAQELGTVCSVSEHRLARQWQAMFRKELPVCSK